MDLIKVFEVDVIDVVVVVFFWISFTGNYNILKENDGNMDVFEKNNASILISSMWCSSSSLPSLQSSMVNGFR